MKIGLYYFTGTGNTRFFTYKIAQGMHSIGLEAQPLEIKDHPSFDPSLEAFGVLFPSYSWRVPWPMERWARKQNFQDKPCFVFCNFAGDAGNTLPRFHNILQNKGARVFMTSEALSWESWTTVRVQAYLDLENKQTLPSIDPVDLGEKIGLAIKNGKTTPTKPKFKITGWDLLSWLYKPSLINSIQFLRVQKDKCNKCGTCAKICPTNSITYGPHPIFHRPCAQCYGCVNLCPQDAIDSMFTKGKFRYKPSFSE